MSFYRPARICATLRKIIVLYKQLLSLNYTAADYRMFRSKKDFYVGNIVSPVFIDKTQPAGI